ncbi:MAG: hypothetical protein OEN52_11260 [Gammaproteobacteria bacterium]|nr:hypothetical protein [Gammaproteobacteria bacterium]
MVLAHGEPLEPSHWELIEQGIAEMAGVIRADLSLSQGGMVVIEYDPYVTSPTVLHEKIREVYTAAELRTVFVSRAPAEEDDKISLDPESHSGAAGGHQQ